MTIATHITVRVPFAIRRRPGRKTLITPIGAHGGPPATAGRADPALLKALARAHRWRRLLDDGRYASLSEMAAAERIDRGYLGRLLQLTLIAPDIMEAILNGRQPARLELPRLLDSVPADWSGQQQVLFGGDRPLTPACRATAR